MGGGCHGGGREREGEEIAMNVSVLPNAVGGAVFVASKFHTYVISVTTRWAYFC